eukprot:jgi/Tetstr1/454943/TSEL_041804.t1
MDPSQVQEGEAIRMCQFLDRPITADNLVTVSNFLAQHGGTAQHAVEDPLCDWSTWKDFLEVGGDDAVHLKIKLANGRCIEVFYPFMLFNADILVRMLSALQPALVSLARYMGAKEGKPVYVSSGGNEAADLFNGLTHMTGKHAQGNRLQNNARDPDCHRLRQAYFEMLVGRTGDVEEDAISEATCNSWAEKVLDARNKLVHSKYNNGDDLVLSKTELEDVLLCSTAILEAYNPELKPRAAMANAAGGDASLMELREKFRIALQSVQALMPLQGIISKARALAKARKASEVDRLFYNQARPLEASWIVADQYRPMLNEPLLAVRTVRVLPICVEEPDIWRFVATILEKNLRPFVEITSTMAHLGTPAWARGRQEPRLESPDLQAILKHLRGNHRDNYYESLKKVKDLRNHFSHLVGMIVADTSSFDMEDMFHTVLQFLEICSESSYSPRLQTEAAFRDCADNIDDALRSINKVRTMWHSVRKARRTLQERHSIREGMDAGAAPAAPARPPAVDNECPVCFDSHQEIQQDPRRHLAACQPCGHVICSTCADGLRNSAQQSLRRALTCPACRAAIGDFQRLHLC